MQKMPGIKIVADEHDLCGECPMWNADSGTLCWVDITGGKFHTLPWLERSVQTIAPDIAISGFAFHESGGLVAAGAEGVWLWNGEAKMLLAREFEGETLAINDCLADARGRLLAGSTFFDGSDSYPPGKLYCMDTDGSISVLDSGFRLANGMGFSPDHRTLYVTDSAERRIYTYDYDLSTARVHRRRTFVVVPSHEGLPDGLTVDAEGYVWSAQWFGGCLCRYDPQGVLEQRIPVPADQVSSLTFGGPDLTDIFVTSAAQLDALALAPPGYGSSGSVGGPLFHLNLGIAGRLEFRCSIVK